MSTTNVQDVYQVYIIENRSSTKTCSILNIHHTTLSQILTANNIIKSKEAEQECKSAMYKARALKTQATMLATYGATSTFGSKELMDKVKKSNMLKWGSEQVGANIPEIAEKIKKTNNNKFGVDNYFQRTDLVQQSYMSSLGVNNPQQLENVKEKTKQTNNIKFHSKELDV